MDIYTKTMKNKDFLLKNLIDIGLTENEAAVYFALLSLGGNSVTKIARVTEIKRTTVYNTIENLVEKGLVRLELTGLKNTYVPEDPSKLKQILDLRAQKFDALLPDLNALYVNKGIDGSIKQYQGLRAIKVLYTQLLNEVGRGEDYCVITDQEKWLNLDPHFFEKFIEKRAELNLNIRLLFTKSSIAEKHKQFERNFNQAVKFLPDKTKLSTNLIITKHKVIIHRLEEPYKAIVIDDPLVVEMHKASFEVMWDSIN